MFKKLKRKMKLSTGREGFAGMGSGFRFQAGNSGRYCRLLLLSGSFLLLLIYAYTAHAGTSLLDNEKKELYSQGTEYFHQATQINDADPAAARDLYGKALLRFERLAAEGEVKNGKLYYNIGNIHFLLDDIGRAILNYRRAEQYIPNDPNLAKNLAYARSMRQDKLESKDKEKILQTLFFFHYDLGTHTRLLLFVIFYASFWIVAGMRIFTRRPFTRWGLGVTLLCTLLFGISLFMESRQAAMNHHAESYQASFEDPLHGGTEFALLEERGAWWQIELPDGRSSWILAKSGELVGRD